MKYGQAQPNNKLILIAILFLLSACETIDKGFYEVTDAVTDADRVTGKRVSSLYSREDQIKKADEIALKLIEDANENNIKLNERADKIQYKRVKSIFEKLHKVSHLSEENWTIILVDKDEWNAFVLGGTYIFVYLGLANDLTDDSELAAVIGHEMAHISANHGFERQSHQTLAKLSGSKSAKRDTYKTAYTHENEAEADQIGILYSALAGFKPYASHDLWKKRFKETGTGGQYFQSHPINIKRSENAKKTADSVNQYYIAGEVNPNARDILKNNSLFKYEENDLDIGEGGGFLAFLSAAAESYSKHQGAKTEELRQQSRILFIKNTEKYMTLIKSEAISNNSWKFTFEYAGYYSIKSVSFKTYFIFGETDIVTIPFHGIQEISPRTNYSFSVESDDFNFSSKPPVKVLLELDYAERK